MKNKRNYQLNPRIKAMICTKCGASLPVSDYFYGCPHCLEQGENASVTFVYKGTAKIDSAKHGWQKYTQFLPYDNTISLGEGNTPVIRLDNLCDELGLEAVYSKNEFQNPTGSHKDRMNPFITARANQLSYDTVTCASSGNEAASLAAYAAADGLKCVNVSTASIPALWKNASDATGAKLVLVPTSPDRLAYQREHFEGKWYPATNLLDVPTSSSSYGIQGYKTISFELFDEFGMDLPDFILIPTCRGDLLYGIYEGFLDLQRNGFISQIPRLVACEPTPRLELILNEQYPHTAKFSGSTSATSSIGGNTATWQSVCALKGSCGLAVSVSQEDAIASVSDMARYGLYLETSSAIVYPCLKKMIASGDITKSDRVLLILTSNGYKNQALEG